jgi:hypothetical protein
MNKYGEILAEIQRVKKTITGVKKAEEKEKRALLRYEVAHGESEEARAQALQALREAEAETAKEYERETRAKMIIEILKANAGRVLYEDNIGKICEIWNSYAGKPYGEKTRDKIREEMREKLGLSVWVSEQYGAKISIHTTDQKTPHYWHADGLEVYGIYKDGESAHALNGENKMQELTPEKLRLSYIGEYIDDPKKHADKIIKLHQKARQALKAFEDIASEYNQATRGKIERINPREGVKNWII